MRILDFLRGLFRRPPRSSAAPIPPPPPDVDQADRIGDLLRMHNLQRGNRPLLRLDPQLYYVAQLQADWMAETGRVTHAGNPVAGLNLSARLRKVEYLLKNTAENVAGGQRNVNEVMQAWVSSPAHRANILGPYEDVGFGIATASDGTIYWCAVFGTR